MERRPQTKAPEWAIQGMHDTATLLECISDFEEAYQRLVARLTDYDADLAAKTAKDTKTARDRLEQQYRNIIAPLYRDCARVVRHYTRHHQHTNNTTGK
ncbi:hypothetical protein HGQ17_01160 [Nesterenkonia sp. MY13]|uniref:Uncharacterized protein n=1 Tax=Nesterenkonia sedimenti TaxID=1463632 RepID=A0A7X8YCJ4_9MICC|nr:hypothetical protein [Nesterenkonia sedimenti]NLS08634.1 hypothetical protein [Nesterenkonia sedimenti]